MLSPETFTEDDVRAVLTVQSWRRARDYVARVRDRVRTDSTLSARVPGTRLYRVTAVVGPDRILGECTCPYEWSGYCKHIGAILLAWLQSPESFASGGAGAPVDDYARQVLPVDPPPTQPWEDLPFWLTTSVEAVQLADQTQLHEWLLNVKLVDLRQMARSRAWRVKGTRKSDVAQQISEFIVDAADIARAVSDLSDEQRIMLSALLLLGSGSRTREPDLERVLTAWGGPSADQPTDSYSRRLWQMGLALPGYARERGGRQGFVPLAVARHLPPLLDSVATDLPVQAGREGVCLADPSAMVSAAIQITLLLEKQPVVLRPPMPRPALEKHHPQLKQWDYDLDEVVRAEEKGELDRQQELKLSVPAPRPALPDEAIQRLSPAAGGDAQLEFVYSLLVAAGVFQPGSPTTVSPEVKAEFLHRGESAQRSVLSRVFFHMQNWSALWEVLWERDDLRLMRNSRYNFYGPADLRSDLRLIRHLVLRALSLLPDDTWLETRALCGLMHAVWPVFDQPAWDTFRFGYMLPSRRGWGPWFLTSNGQPLRQDNTADWGLAQGSFIRRLISGPLHWLGLADLYYEEGELAAFRLHGLADLYWDRLDSPDVSPEAVSAWGKAPPAEAVTTSGLTVSVDPAAISPAAHSLLDEIARLDVAETDRFVYRVDPRAAYESFESGVTLDRVLEGWQQQFPILVPDAIRENLSTWWEAYGRVRIYEGLTIVEFGDDYALAEMKAVSSLESHLIVEISPRLVIIHRDAVKNLAAELVRAGYTPKVEDQDANA